jgi:hypothetical protein
MEKIRSIWMSNSQVGETPDKMSITSQIRKRIPIRSTERNIELHMSLNSTLISKSNTSKKILNIPFLGDKETIIVG